MPSAHERLTQLRDRIALLSRTRALRTKNKALLDQLYEQEVQFHLDAVDEAYEAKRPKGVRGIHYRGEAQ